MAPRTRPGPDTPADVVDLDDHRPAPAPAPPRMVLEVPLEQIEDDAGNVRAKLRDLDGLAASIKAVGVLEPCLVEVIGPDRYRLIAGHRRRAAAALAGLTTIPCLEHTGDLAATGRVGVQLVENLQRDDLTPLEEARGYQALVDAGETQRAIAARVGRNQSHISKRLRLLTLPKKAAAAIDAGEITVEDGLALSELADHPEHVSEAMARYAQAVREDGGPYPGLMTECVADEVRALEYEAKRAATFEELTAAGIRVINWPARGRAGPWPTGYRRMDLSHLWPGHKTPTKARVQKGGHLAAAVDSHGTPLYLCTDPGRYETTPKASTPAAGGDKREQAAQAAAAETRAINKRRRAESKARLAVAGRFVRNAADGEELDRRLDEAITGHRSLGAPTSIFIRSLLLTWLAQIGSVWVEPTKTALELLDIDPDTRSYGLLERLAAQPEYRGRVELAVWIALAEQRILMAQLYDPAVPAYYAWLATQGYQPTADEQHDLAGPLGRARAS